MNQPDSEAGLLSAMGAFFEERPGFSEFNHGAFFRYGWESLFDGTSGLDTTLANTPERRVCEAGRRAADRWSIAVGGGEAVQVARATKVAAEAGITIDQLGGNCPVQGEGTFDGLRFYFRARGKCWQFHVARTDAQIFEDELAYVQRLYTPTDGGPAEYAAGWMPIPEAIDFIIAEVAAFRARREQGLQKV